jgi:hypothetical protein
MANALGNWVDRFLGRGEAAVTVPPLDGALKPNNLLEEARIGLGIPAPDNLVSTGETLIFSSGDRLLRQPADGSAGALLGVTEGPVAALAWGAGGVLAVAAGGRISFRNAGADLVAGLSGGAQDWSCVTAMDFAPDGSLVIAIGSSKNGLEDWQRDLLDGESAGSVWRLDPKTGKAKQIASKLAYPNGIAVEADGNIIVSEAWQKRLIRLAPDGRLLGQVMEDLPGYPARIGRSVRGGYWLSIFAPRSPLIEFVLREPAYRKAMMAEVDKAFWIAPALRSGRSFREPMQGGALKQMGILKPWAPTRSYGLVVELDAGFVPLRSVHSRAGGSRHGVTSAVEAGGKLWATAKGGDELVAIDLGKEGV